MLILKMHLEMVYTEQMVNAAMTVSLSWVCGDSWFILGAMITLHPRCAVPPSPESNQSDSGQVRL